MIDPDRGTGRTTRQMLAAPQRAIFISCNECTVSHDRHLAKKHGRPDLQIVPPRWISDQRWRGHELTGIVVDHAAKLTDHHIVELHHALTRVR
jgi:hypothetical protein